MTGLGSLLQGHDSHRKLLKAVPISGCAALHFGDVFVDRFNNISCTFHHHVGDLCVAAEGHNITSHRLNEILGRLGGGGAPTAKIGETKELYGWIETR